MVFLVFLVFPVEGYFFSIRPGYRRVVAGGRPMQGVSCFLSSDLFTMSPTVDLGMWSFAEISRRDQPTSEYAAILPELKADVHLPICSEGHLSEE